jgi:hypothetical protein
VDAPGARAQRLWLQELLLLDVLVATEDRFLPRLAPF